ncbi:hypothetical protein [Aliamphritea spongicola]|uniref:hypothetical protein n=1 Tax=Aliamphritea spongicola TaxID=707589 RepID=UPI00196BAF7A|nr:hypothetical protein [Aliamphritea spongicola]MBN3562373.1 hypothetical protein [Aliamphritea spongicola]
MSETQKLTADRWLQRLMKTGIPVALISVLSLWLAWWLQSLALGSVFLVTMVIALGLGFAYNIRLVILSLRARKKANMNDN